MNASIHNTEFAAIDFESAGTVKGSGDFPVQIGIAVWRDGAVCEMLRSYIACDAPVTWSAQKIHGISTEMLADAPSLNDLWPRIRDLLQGRVVVAHGAATERRFLRAFPFHGFGPWVDTLALVRATDPHLPSHKLADACEHHALLPALQAADPNFRWHDALSDALASLMLCHTLIAKHSITAVEALLKPRQSQYYRARRRGA